jgi:AsmA protein
VNLFCKNIKTKSLILKILIKVVFWIAAFLLLLSISAFVLLLIYKDDISKILLLRMNNSINGKISFTDISLSPLKHFPDIALKLADFSLVESKDLAKGDSLPIFQFEDVYLSLDIIDLLSSRVNINKITFENGIANLVIYQDGMINLDKAIKGVPKVKPPEQALKKKPGQEKPLPKQEKPIKAKPSEVNLNIDELIVSNVKLLFNNERTKNRLDIRIQELDTEFSIAKRQIEAVFDFNFILDTLIINNKPLFSNQNIVLESKLDVDMDSGFVKIKDGKFFIDKVRAEFYGTFDSKNDGNIDLKLSGIGKDFSLLSLFLSEKAMKNFKSADAQATASLKGKTYLQTPVADIKFSLIDASIVNPVTHRLIKNLNLKGSFNSGDSADFSQAILEVDTLYADFPDGSIKLSGEIKNFQSPEIDIGVFLDADVTGLNEVFKLKMIDKLTGKINLNEKVKGQYIPTEKKFKPDYNKGTIKFNDFGISIPKILKLDRVNGTIKRDNDIYFLNDLSIVYEDTDLLINGEIENIHYLFFDIEKEIAARLEIQSSVFDLPNFLIFDPYIKNSFPYRITDLNLIVDANTSTTKILNSISFPEFEFNFEKLSATIEKFLPPIKIKSGKFIISETQSDFNMNFKEFKTEFLGGLFDFSAVYNSSAKVPYHLKLDTKFSKIFPSKISSTDSDTISKFLTGRLTGSFSADLQFPKDSTFLKFVNLKNANLFYELPNDTLEIGSMNLNLSNIYFNTAKNSNPLATLYVEGDFGSKKIRSNDVNVDDWTFKFSAVNGSYKMKSEMVRFFGKKANGESEIVIKPFLEIPEYSIYYKVIKFNAEELLRTFAQDTLITGPLSLTMKINTSGKDWESMVFNVNGLLELNGQDLIFYGFDADEIMEKFKRSQSFNFVDLGAFMLAGPVGIAVTKGTDFARILAFNTGKKTVIKRLISNWDIKGGMFSIKDAAFSTNKNRFASKGFIDFSNKNLELELALLNKKGCSVFSQAVYGNLDSPTLGKVKVPSTVLAPVTNLVDDILGTDCDVFYKGSLPHPN